MYYTLENFIDYCNDNEIAEESAQDMYDCHNKYYEKLGKIAISILDTDDIKKVLKLCDDYLKCLKDYRNKLASIHYTYDESKEIKTAELVKHASRATSVLAGTVAGSIADDKWNNDNTTINTMLATNAATNMASKAIIQSKFTEDIKSDYEEYIEDAEFEVERLKKRLEDALQKGYTTISEIRHVYRVEAYDNKIMVCKKLFKKLKPKK